MGVCTSKSNITPTLSPTSPPTSPPTLSPTPTIPIDDGCAKANPTTPKCAVESQNVRTALTESHRDSPHLERAQRAQDDANALLQVKTSAAMTIHVAAMDVHDRVERSMQGTAMDWMHAFLHVLGANIPVPVEEHLLGLLGSSQHSLILKDDIASVNVLFSMFKAVPETIPVWNTAWLWDDADVDERTLGDIEDLSSEKLLVQVLRDCDLVTGSLQKTPDPERLERCTYRTWRLLFSLSYLCLWATNVDSSMFVEAIQAIFRNRLVSRIQTICVRTLPLPSRTRSTRTVGGGSLATLLQTTNRLRHTAEEHIPSNDAAEDPYRGRRID